MVSDCIGGKKSKNKQTSSASKACWIFFYITSVFDWSGGIFLLKSAQILLFYNVIVLVFIGYSLDCSSVIWVNGLCDIISKLISSNKAHQSSMWGGWTMLSSFAGFLWTLWQSCQACCVYVCVWKEETEAEGGGDNKSITGVCTCAAKELTPMTKWPAFQSPSSTALLIAATST